MYSRGKKYTNPIIKHRYQKPPCKNETIFKLKKNVSEVGNIAQALPGLCWDGNSDWHTSQSFWTCQDSKTGIQVLLKLLPWAQKQISSIFCHAMVNHGNHKFYRTSTQIQLAQNVVPEISNSILSSCDCAHSYDSSLHRF